MSASRQIYGKTRHEAGLVPAALVRPAVADVIRRAHPDWSVSGFVCVADLNGLRSQYVQGLLETEKGELTTLEADVRRSLEEHEILASNVEQESTTGVSPSASGCRIASPRSAAAGAPSSPSARSSWCESWSIRGSC